MDSKLQQEREVNGGTPFAEARGSAAGKVCWLCKKTNPTIRTKPQPPDNEEWWFHEKCYLELQDILY